MPDTPSGAQKEQTPPGAQKPSTPRGVQKPPTSSGVQKPPTSSGVQKPPTSSGVQKPHDYEPVIGLEVHAELQTRSKMFCTCPVVDSVEAAPNRAVCPVCAGMPGVLPVLNQQAVEYGLRVALALECTLPPQSVFARKNYFYPDLPKGYQISQYEYPLAVYGKLAILTHKGEQVVRIRRVHLEEDTGKLTHVNAANPPEAGGNYSLVDLNRAGVPLLEIVSEPDLHSLEAVRAYATALRALLRYLGVNSGDMEKGVIRFEANVSIRPRGVTELGTRVEIKNLNSFRALERAVGFEIQRQANLANKGQAVAQETLGWDEAKGVTFTQRSKEDAHDYRYFPEPDLPPLVIEKEWIEQVRAGLPELPYARFLRFQKQYELSAYDANLLVSDQEVAVYFEAAAAAAEGVAPKIMANWILGDLFSLLNQRSEGIATLKVTPAGLAELVKLVSQERINAATAKNVLAEMAASGKTASRIITEGSLQQISDTSSIAGLVEKVLRQHTQEVDSYLAGKETLAQWFFGQVMRAAQNQANPQVVRAELQRQLQALKEKDL
jgi:aspartyl-tRNA(Asn)/glutamyl-tRNA(Gln) amidotransferase subunit B